ncbi:hypothetical protein KEH56_10160 [Burkholderia cenocepacia]|uniref:hypothetical protein n=1 Tax=Burkholderia cenocepacia TaxID=95486 RepID=UPI001BADB456|nr:hypothetical protein [Burkholderia cenocepacia]QUN40724.1 hypothetical protein KEH56_10160 [Burkholderia cenocepacia]QUO30645.1 hypothetical protein KEH57_23815 [Burkholderia cenocepacia]
MSRTKPETATDTEMDGAVENIEQIVTAPVPLAPPRLGEQIAVVAGAGRVVINREFGGRYSETDSIPATVNLRILRLLEDGDLIRRPIE